MTVPTFELASCFDDAERLIGHDGARYPKIEWASPLERKLIFTTRFPARARRICAAFERYFSADRSSESERSELVRWVISVAPYLGSPAIDHAAELTSLFPSLTAFAAREKTALARFLDDVAEPPLLSRRNKKSKRRVAVFYGELGGGTRTTADAIAELLRETEDMEPVLLSAHIDAGKQEGSFFKAFGITETDAWNRGFYDFGNPEVMDRCRKARSMLRHYFVPNRVEEAARLVSENGASHVLSLLPGYPQLTQIATDDVPVTLLHADFGLNATLSGEEPSPLPAPYRLLDPNRVTIGLVSAEPEPMLDRIRTVIGERLDRLVRVLGFPVRRPFSRPASAADLDRIRERLGVSPDVRVVVLMMGQDGMGDRMIRLVRKLLSLAPEAAPPLHIVAVCGRSERSRAAIEEEIRQARRPLRAKVTGMLPADELAGYLHLAARPGPTRGGVVVSKPGGATTAECAAAGAHLLLFPGLPWEEKNRSAAISGGFGESCSDDEFLPALTRALTEPNVHVPPPLDWRARLLSHLRSRI